MHDVYRHAWGVYRRLQIPLKTNRWSLSPVFYDKAILFTEQIFGLAASSAGASDGGKCRRADQAFDIWRAWQDIESLLKFFSV